MALIAKITVQQKRRGRYNIFVQEGEAARYAFSVEEDILVKYGLKKGMELDEAFMQSVLSAEECKRTEQLALRYLAHRMRSEQEVRAYLQQKVCEPVYIEEVINRFKQEKWLDDVSFARAFVRTKVKTTLVGPNKLRQMLAEKGVSEHVQGEALAVYDQKWQKECLAVWIEKQCTKATNARESRDARRRKWMNRLLAKGFALEMVQVALNEVEMKDATEEWEALCFQADKARRTYARRFEGFLLQQKVKQALYRKGFQLNEIERYINERWQER